MDDTGDFESIEVVLVFLLRTLNTFIALGTPCFIEHLRWLFVQTFLGNFRVLKINVFLADIGYSVKLLSNHKQL